MRSLESEALPYHTEELGRESPPSVATQAAHEDPLPTDDISSTGVLEVTRMQSICSAYLRGQLSNVAKAAVWWSTFGVLAEAVTNIPVAVGMTRLVFNLALVFVSPIAGVVSEKVPIHSLLTLTTWGRFLIWCCFIPTSWILTGFYHLPSPIFYAFFLCFVFLDGVQVAFANIMDIDCGGLLTLAHQYKLQINDRLSERFNRIHQTMFDVSFIFLTPPVAFVVWRLAVLLRPPCDTTVDSIECIRKDVAFLLAGVCGAFGCLSLYTLWNYRAFSLHPPSAYHNEDDYITQRDLSLPMMRDQEQFRRSRASSFTPVDSSPCRWKRSPDGSVEMRRSVDASEESANSESSCHRIRTIRDRFEDVKDGFSGIFKERALGWRLLFLAVETAFEDAVVSVILPQVALNMTPQLWKVYHDPVPPTVAHPEITRFTTLLKPVTSPWPGFLPERLAGLPGTWTLINLVAVSLIAIGKTGGLAAGTYMHSRWTPPESLSQGFFHYRALFRYMCFSSMSLLVLPLANWILQRPYLLYEFGLTTVDNARTWTLFVVVIFLGVASFLFFIFSTAPKVGFATLLHTLVTQRNIDLKIFAFIGTFVTVTDALVILTMNSVFAFFGSRGFQTALCIIAVVYAAHGLNERFLGPRLILDVQNAYVDSSARGRRTDSRDSEDGGHDNAEQHYMTPSGLTRRSGSPGDGFHVASDHQTTALYSATQAPFISDTDGWAQIHQQPYASKGSSPTSARDFYPSIAARRAPDALEPFVPKESASGLSDPESRRVPSGSWADAHYRP